MGGGGRQAELGEKQIAHQCVVVLSRMHQQRLKAGGQLLQGGQDGTHLNEIGPCADDTGESSSHVWAGYPGRHSAR